MGRVILQVTKQRKVGVLHMGPHFSINQYILDVISSDSEPGRKRLNQHVISGEFSSNNLNNLKTLGFLVTFDDFCLTFCWYHRLPSSENPLSQGFCRPAKAAHRDPLIDARI